MISKRIAFEKINHKGLSRDSTSMKQARVSQKLNRVSKIIFSPVALLLFFRVSLVPLIILPFSIRAQTFGNEWINYNQQYYKIPATQPGIYRITKSDLQDAGFPVVSVDPRRIQLFHRGQEQALLVNGEGDAIFNDNDYIEFYGQGNDGTLDAELYQPETAQPHPTTTCILTPRLTS